jgi:hypothetical protein
MDLSLDFYTEQVDPTASDNFAAGFYLFNEWYNETNQKLWKCTGDGVWTDITETGGGGLTPEEESILRGSITGLNATGVTITAGNSPLVIPMTNLTGVNFLGYGIVTGAIIIPVSGWYQITAQVTGISDARRNNHRIEILRNGIVLQGFASAGYTRTGSGQNFGASIAPRQPTTPLAQGDSISLRLVWEGQGGADMTTNPQESYISLEYKGS